MIDKARNILSEFPCDMLRSFARFDIVQEREEFFGFKRSFASGETRRAENVVISLRVFPLRRVRVGVISRGGRRGRGGDRHGWSGCGRIGTRAWETVGEATCIGVLTFLAILRAGEGDLRGMRRGVSSTGLEGGDFFRFVTSEKRREGAGGVPQI